MGSDEKLIGKKTGLLTWQLRMDVRGEILNLIFFKRMPPKVAVSGDGDIPHTVRYADEGLGTLAYTIRQPVSLSWKQRAGVRPPLPNNVKQHVYR